MRRRWSGSFALTFTLALVAGTGTAQPLPPAGESGTDRDVDFFEKRVRPILEAECFRCHGGKKKIKGGLRLTRRQGVLKGGDTGPAVILEKPESSLILRAISYSDENLEMPPAGRLENEQIEVLTRWVKMGIPWGPTGKSTGKAEVSGVETGARLVTPEARNFWSFRPVARPRTPSVRDEEWVRNPIDAFVLHRLEESGLRPPKPADKVALLRRAYYNLTGLPPSPAEVDAFLADSSPEGFEKVVDRLLDSKRYGERWARHWLDVVRFAETDSFERDNRKPDAWRYRDYVIRSFNEDKPYDRFVLEQLAGDELDEVTPEGIVATGYYRLGPWDDEPTDKLQARYDELDDIVATTAKVFLGLTLNCARCHGHKLDPIPQADYYSFLAFFHGVLPTKRGNRSTILTEIATEAEKSERQQKIEAIEETKGALRREIAAVEEVALADLSVDEKRAAGDRRKRGKIVEARLSAIHGEEKLLHYRKLRADLKSQERMKPPPLKHALSVREGGPVAPPTHVLVRGNAHVKGEPVEPAFPSVLGTPPPEIPPPPPGARSSGRRRVLAQWIASKENPLSARVMVNRIWQHHFGRGIVRTPNNFGKVGAKPTHPELLDWLASEFAASGWSIKRMHRLIMGSSTYRMSSRASDGNPGALERDPENELFWRVNMRRLEAEEIRDSILALNGELNLKMGGPGIYTLIPKEVLHGQSRPGSGWGRSSDEERSRRSIYVHVKRSLITPLLATFDFADTDTTCPVRFATTQPTQALTMLNSDFMRRESEAFALRVRGDAGDRPEDQVALALRLALARKPTPEEIQRGVGLMRDLEEEDAASANEALDHFCLMVLNLNEFIYLD